MQIIQAPRASAVLHSLLVKRSDARPWLLPANICPIVPVTFLKARVPFEFIDLSATSLQMNPDRTESLARKGAYAGLLYAHTYGEPATPQDLFTAVKQAAPDMFIIDDRCLCIPDLEPFPTVADVVLYSTGYSKVAELNFGGFAYVQDDVDYQPAHLQFDEPWLRSLERDYKEAVQKRARFAYMDRDWLDTESPLPAWSEYRKRITVSLEASLETRDKLNKIYAAGLPAEVQLGGEFQTWRFNIRVPNQSRILEAIFAAGLFASTHYASLAGIMADGCAPVAEGLASEVVNLFNDHHFTPEMAESISGIIRENLL